MNTTINESSCFSPLNSTAAKSGKTFVYCSIFVVSLVGNSFIGIVVYKTQTLRKPINYFIVHMAMSDLLYPVFWIPKNLTGLFVESWLVGGSLGQSLCKLVPFLRKPGSDINGSIWSRGISSSFPTHQFKDVSVLYYCHLDRCDGCVLSRIVGLQTC